MKNKHLKKLRTSLIATMSIAILVLASSNIFATSTVNATTWDPVNKCSSSTLSNGNLSVMFNKTYGGIRATNYKTSGKWYWEVKIDSSSTRDYSLVGIANELANITDLSKTENILGYYGYNGYISPELKPYGQSSNVGDIISVALDIDNKTFKVAKNGNWFSNIDLPIWNKYYPLLAYGSAYNSGQTTTNFGSTPFSYQPPSGFLPFDGAEVLPTEIILNKSTTNLNVGQTEDLIATITPDNATNKNIIWTSSDSTIATVDETGKITTIKEGQATITAKVENADVTATCTVNVTSIKETITVESEKSKLPINQEFTTDIVLHNAKNTFAEDVKINYNKDLFEYIGYENIEGLKIYKEIKNTDTGDLRFIVASQGDSNGINADKALVKLKFKTKSSGTGKVDVTATRIADNIGIEKDLLAENCGEKEFVVFSDVNNTGDFTLGDLAIDGYYYGKNVSDTDATKYNADVVANEKIDDEDLTEITSQIIGNSQYTPNN